MRGSKGYFLIEALLSIVIFSVLVLSVFSMISFLQRRTTRSGFEEDAALLLQEGMEIAHSVLLANWNGYPPATYFPVFDADANSWVLMSGEETELQARYDRKIEVRKVCRDTTSGDILETSSPCLGEIDPRVREITTTIVWKENDQDRQLLARLLILNTNSDE
jgi:type II secretory pathway pseudopilin PulG